MDRGYRTVQYSLDHAVHDAALQIDSNSLSEGSIKFLPELAENTFKETLQRNLNIDQDLNPISNIFLEGPIIIKDIVYLDDSYVVPETGDELEFPFIWEAKVSEDEIFERSIFGPSIAVIVDAYVKGSSGYAPFLVIQEYKE